LIKALKTEEFILKNQIPKSSSIGKNVIIEEGVRIGENVKIGDNTVVLKHTHVGDHVTIGCNCVLGIKPGGNKRMRNIQEKNESLIIQDYATIGNLVTIYSSTEIGKHVFIADHASIRENVQIEEGTVVGRGSIIELNTKIGKRCTIQTLAYITGDTVIEDDVFIGPCVSMSNDKYMGAKEYELKGPIIKEGAKIGNNATLLPGVMIGEKGIIGAGSVVTKDVRNNEVVVGVPAKKLQK
jgi:acetyltransferase-like isoleucine patch superfamily enzyme